MILTFDKVGSTKSLPPAPQSPSEVPNNRDEAGHSKSQMNKTLLISFILLLLASLSLQAQEKRERERKIKTTEAPEDARKWLNQAYSNPSSVNWYKQDDSGELSYEAKFKWKSKWHSVKFNPEGNIEDIEIRINRNEIPSDPQKKIWEYFSSNYDKFKIKKIQLQWTGNEKDLLNALQNNQTQNLTLRYEIEFQGRDQNENRLWEGLFDDSGSLIKRSKIILAPTDNLTY